MPRRTKPTRGQIDLIGNIYNYELKYTPHKQTTKTGESVIVLRIPEGADEIDIRTAQKAAKELSNTSKSAPNKFYRFKKPRHKD